jgi:hypothetical protein
MFMNDKSPEQPLIQQTLDITLANDEVKYSDPTTAEIEQTTVMERANDALSDGVDQLSIMLDSSEIDEPIAQNDKFFKSRWKQVKNAMGFGKDVIDTIRDKFSISVYGERLSALENVSVRMYRATYIPVILDITRGTQLGMDHPENNLMSRIAYNRHQRQQSREMSKSDWAKLGAYELLTVPVVRALGLTSLYAATKPFYEKSTDSRLARLHETAAKRIVRHETGEYNPVLRKKGILRSPTGNYKIPKDSTTTSSKAILR